jgi:hypothetical protein
MWKINLRPDYRLTQGELERLRGYHERLWHADGDLSVLGKKEAQDLGRLIRKREKEATQREATQS